MPDQDQWEEFFDSIEIFEKFGLTDENAKGADIACGYGTFTIPLAKLNFGTIYAVDINDEFLSLVEKRALKQNLRNIKTVNGDISESNFRLPEKVSYVLLFNILHCENPETVVSNVIQNLSNNGKIFVIHWRSDIETPRGPPLSIRPKIGDIQILMEKLGFQVHKKFESISDYHNGVSFIRTQ